MTSDETAGPSPPPSLAVVLASSAAAFAFLVYRSTRVGFSFSARAAACLPFASHFAIYGRFRRTREYSSSTCFRIDCDVRAFAQQRGLTSVVTLADNFRLFALVVISMESKSVRNARMYAVSASPAASAAMALSRTTFDDMAYLENIERREWRSRSNNERLP